MDLFLIEKGTVFEMTSLFLNESMFLSVIDAECYVLTFMGNSSPLTRFLRCLKNESCFMSTFIRQQAEYSLRLAVICKIQNK
jgi:hypothetical protein